MKHKKQIRIGIVVVVALVLFIYGFNFLKGRDIFAVDLDLYAFYDNVDGITQNNTVQINGFKVGTIRDVTLDPKTNKLMVHFIITDNNAIITDSSECQIFSDGLMGLKSIKIISHSGGKPVKDKAVLRGTNESGLKDQVSEMVIPLKKKLEGLVGSVDSVVQVFNAVLNQSARNDLTASFASIKKSLTSFEKISVNLNDLVVSQSIRFSDILAKIQSISTKLASNNEPLSKAINNFANISDSISKSKLKTVIDSASSIMSRTAVIMDKINNGQGSMGLLINDKKLYDGLNKATTDLDALIIDLKANPKRYFSVFGNANKKNPDPTP